MDDEAPRCHVPPCKPSGLKLRGGTADTFVVSESTKAGDRSEPLHAVNFAESKPPELEFAWPDDDAPTPQSDQPKPSDQTFEKLIEFMKEQFKQQEDLLRSLLQQSEGPLPGGRQISNSSSRNGRRVHATESDSVTSDSPVKTTRRQMSMAAQESMEARQVAERVSARVSQNAVEPQVASMHYLSWVHGPAFGHCMFLVMFVNIVLVGVEAEMFATLPADQIPDALDILNFVLIAIYIAEFLLKVAATGVWYHFRGPEYAWNQFDFVFVVMAVVEVVIEVVVSSSGLTSVNMSTIRIVRLLRLGRMLRGIRIVRMMRFMASLRQLLHSIFNTLKSLFWTLLLLLMLFYAVGTALTQVVADHCRLEAIETSGDVNAVPQCQAPAFKQHWGNLSESMLTLFMAISSGISWAEVIHPLREVSPVAVSVFIAYIVFSCFAVLNVVTGVFCQSAMESAANDKELAAMSHLSNQQSYVDTIRELFQEIDGDFSGVVTIDEFQEALKNDTLSAFLESIGISTADAWTLFRIIDDDKSGWVDVEEFVNGCLSLRGPAKAIQVAKMSLENSVVRNAVSDIHGDIVAIRRRMCASAVR